jgi:PAS domain S-box-containing protein
VNSRDHGSAQAKTIHRVVRVDVRRIVLQTLLFGVALSVLLTTPVVIHQQAETRNLLNLREAEQERVIKLAAQSIRQEMDAVLSDLRYLSQHNEIRTYLEKPDRSHRRDLANEYLVLAKQKRIYDHIRFIGIDGKEAVRVDFADGKPKIRPEQDLQNKRDRYYFQETQWLAPGQIFVSPFDLNVEQGAIEQPLKPTIRFAVPVADDQGQIRGMVVLNYLGQRLIDKLGLLAGQAGNIWLLNAKGDWLIGPTRQDEWGFMYRPRPNAAPYLDAFRRQVMQEKSGSQNTEATSIRFERIYPLTSTNLFPNSLDFAQPEAANRYYWTLAASRSPSSLKASNTFMPQDQWPIYVTLSLFAFLAAGSLSFSINRNKTLAESLEKVIDSLPVLVAYVDTEQRYRFNNKTYQGFFGLSPKQIFGKTVREVLDDSAYQEVHPYIEQALAGKQATFEHQLNYQGTGMRDMVVTFLPDASPQGEVRGFFVVANDVSLVKQSERRERQRMLELAHVSRLASMGEMATEIAHEINQPLAAIAMYSAASLRTLQNPGKGENSFDRHQIELWLESINNQAKRASEIVRRVRRFVQTEKHQYGPVNLNQVTTEVVALLRHETQSQAVEVVLQLAADLPPVQGELILLEQVIFNLLRNALEALLPLPSERKITLLTAFDADRVYIEVSDTGRGIAPEIGDSIFETFVTSKQEGLGLGLGLAISRSIIEAHAGKLGYVINPEGGTTFKFSLNREPL